MVDYEEILSIPPFSLNKNAKQKIFSERLKDLTNRHYHSCLEYRRMLDAIGFDPKRINNCSDLPFLPVSLFRELDLLSIDKSEVFKVMTSSGTTGQTVSKIFLDKTTASNQQKTLVKIVSNFTGSSRMPMLIIDSPSVVKNRTNFSARGAGILGFSIFGSDKTYALDDEMNIDFDAIEGFLQRHQGQKILLFGFTFIIWQHFYQELLKFDKKMDLSNGIMIHGGGWKKLTAEAVSQEKFKQSFKEICNLANIRDYYGMVEQTGCIYMECEYGNLHASIFSDVITRRYMDFSSCEIGESGIIQVVSMLPESYPGHSLLTEDEGIILGEDDCSCGRAGKYFKIYGRLQNAEIRGCSDTYAAEYR